MAKKSPVDKYIKGVLSGKILAGKYIRLACERHIADIANAEKLGIYFDIEAADHVINFFKKFIVHSKGEWAGNAFDPEPWQVFVLCSIFGWKRKSDKFRRFRTAYIEVPRKNGKTTMAAGVGLYLLVADNEPGAEIFTAATKLDQAKIAHGEATRMVKASQFLRDIIGIFKNNLHIESTHSKYEPLGADADTMDGLNIHGGIIDELHAHKTRLMWDVLNTATGARRQPLIFSITTSGSNRESVCREQHDYGKKILSNMVRDETVFCFIAAMDVKEREGDYEDDWTKEETWRKANPSYGVSVKPDDIKRKMLKAKESPASLNAFLRLHLNKWCIVYGTLITMANGARTAIENIRTGDNILAFDEKTKSLKKAKVIQVLDNGIQTVYKITSARGRAIATTGNHKFWCRYGRSDNPEYGWIAADKLKLGSRISIALGHNLPRGSLRIKAIEAKFIGMMIGDGSCNHPIRFTNTNDGVISFMKSFVESHGCKLVQHLDGVHYDIRHQNKSLKRTLIRKLLIKHDISKKTCYNKRVSASIFKGGHRVWASFLSGYLDTDGHVGKRSIVWVSCNRELLDDCQHLLALLGIQSTIRESPKRYYRLEVHNAEGLEKLANTLELSNTKKKKDLCGLSKLKRRIGNAASDRHIFDVVKKIEIINEQPTIGMEVERYHTHITNGFITHNTQQVDRWIDMQVWNENNTSEISETNLVGRRCYGGLDLSSVSDISAWVMAFPDEEDPDKIDVLARLWCPEDRLYDSSNKYKEQYQMWHRQGFLEVTPGNCIDFAFVRARILEDAQRFQLIDMNIDRLFQAHQLAMELIDEGIAVCGMGMGYLSFAAPMKDFERRLLARKINHGGNPVLRWMADNVAVSQDPAGNIKPNKAESQGKVDGIVALVMSIDRVSRNVAGGTSVYEERGLMTAEI